MCAGLLLATGFVGDLAWADEFSYSGDEGPGFWSETVRSTVHRGEDD
jgi:hypothetical protein